MRTIACTLMALIVASGTQRVLASAVNFQDPNDWNVGDPDSTFQEWDADPIDFLGDPDVFVFSASGTTPSSNDVNPVLSSDSTLSVTSPGFVGSSGGYYSLSGDYSIQADVFNHGGSSGIGGPYSPNHGTRVIVQTAATRNDDPNQGGPGSVVQGSLELVQIDGSPIGGGDNASAQQILEVSDPNLLVDSPFGLVAQQELVFEFWLPGYTGDFRVQTDLVVHASFQHLRVDTLIVEESSNADFNNDGSIDGLDFLTWQVDPNAHGGRAGLADWKNQYGSSTTVAAVSSIPEPHSALLAVAGLLGIGRLFKSRHGC